MSEPAKPLAPVTRMRMRAHDDAAVRFSLRIANRAAERGLYGMRAGALMRSSCRDAPMAGEDIVGNAE
jgi:hypothetical protein